MEYERISTLESCVRERKKIIQEIKENKTINIFSKEIIISSLEDTINEFEIVISNLENWDN